MKLLPIRKVVVGVDVMAQQKSRGSFAATAQQARTRTPRGISQKEGRWILVVSLGSGALLTVTFLSGMLRWGGAVQFGAQWAHLALLIAFLVQLSGTSRVHPVGHKRRVVFAGLPMVLVAFVGGWFWGASAEHDTHWVITTVVAMLSVVPLAAVGFQLIRKADR